jgi:hypothetical protein
MSKEVRDFAELYKIKLLKSSLYYAQANDQENPRRWHKVLSEALWTHRISRHGVTKVTPFEIVYG